jgi:hypothetical protein
VAEPIQAYPLAWPPGWRRTSFHQRVSHSFKRYGSTLSVPDGVQRVLRELQLLGVREDDIVISSNVRPTLSGVPSSKGGTPGDSGVAVYWSKRGQKAQRCIAVDKYQTVAGNLGAIAATLEAMRAIERHGGAEILDRAFMGFAALPAPEQPFQVLGVGANASREEVERAYRLLAAKHHPDRPGGDAHAMARINAARDALLEEQR